jgi:hypothetical protein
MKTDALCFVIVLAATSVVAQSQPSGVISRSPDSRPESSSVTVTNAPGEMYSLDRIAAQIRELHRAVNQTVPMLDALTQSETNSISGGQQPSGGLAGILGNILRRNTNQTAGSSAESTNAWGNILRGVLGGNTNSAASASSAPTTLSDLAALREQLQNLAPLLERLDSGSASTNGLSPTGRQ